MPIQGRWAPGFRAGLLAPSVTLLLAMLLTAIGAAGQVRRGAEASTREEDIRFGSDDVTLAGTLVLPSTRGPHPAVVIIHGSGPDEGSEYRIYAAEFAQGGIVALTYDKRGSGGSSGDWRRRTLDELTGDALAAVRYLKGRRDINPEQIGLWGISQGSWIVPRAASRSPDVAFVITVAGDGVSPTQQEMYHKDEMFRHLGYSERARETALKVWRLIFDGLLRIADGTLPVPKGFMEPELSGAYFGLDYDPIPDWEQVRQPALLIYGEEDRLTPVAESIARLRAAFQRSRHTDHSFLVYPGASHNITLGKTGLEFEWDRGFAPGYFETMNEWILMRVRREPAGDLSNAAGPYLLSPDFADRGRYGRLPSYGRAFPQMAFMLVFFCVFLAGLTLWLVGSFWRLRQGERRREPAHDRWTGHVQGALSMLNLVLLIGFLVLILEAIFPQGMSVMPAYAIPVWLRVLPLLGVLSALLTVLLIALVVLSWKGVHTPTKRWERSLIILSGLAFLPWLAYWNLIGLPL